MEIVCKLKKVSNVIKKEKDLKLFFPYYVDINNPPPKTEETELYYRESQYVRQRT